MARALSVQVKEFMDMWLSPNLPPPNHFQGLLPPVKYSIIFEKYPYEHNMLHRRKYEYSVKDGFELVMKKPYEIDLMGNYKTRDAITYVLKENGIAPDYEVLNKYMQIVIHHQTYTALFNMKCGKMDKVLEIIIEPDETPLQ